MGSTAGPLHGKTMAVPVVYYPVTPVTGGEVHATSLEEPARTICGHKFVGWAIAPKRLTCKRCKELLHHPVQAGAKAVAR